MRKVNDCLLDYKISIIMPAYNVSSIITHSIYETIRTLDATGFKNYEIIVVNDGSTDETKKMVKKIIKIFKEKVKMISYSKNMGKGFALKRGFEISSGEIIVFYDADLDLPPYQIASFIYHLIEKKVDVVIGSKYLPGAKVRYSTRRWILSLGYKLLITLLLGLNVSDTQVGLKVFRRYVLEAVLPKITISKYAFDIELLTLINMFGYKITELPIILYQRSSFSSINIKAILRMFYDTMIVFLRKIAIKKSLG